MIFHYGSPRGDVKARRNSHIPGGCLWHNQGKGCLDVKGKDLTYLIIDMIIAYCHT